LAATVCWTVSHLSPIISPGQNKKKMGGTEGNW